MSYKSFSEFWPLYVSQHSNRMNRACHFIGTILALVILAAAIVTGRSLLYLVIPVVGYGFAWIGHFVFEKNKPATFQYPFYSLAGDMKLFLLMLRRKI